MSAWLTALHVFHSVTSTTTDSGEDAKAVNAADHAVAIAQIAAIASIVTAALGTVGLVLTSKTKNRVKDVMEQEPEAVESRAVTQEAVLATRERLGDLASNFEKFTLQHEEEHKETRRHLTHIRDTLHHHIQWEETVGNKYAPDDPRFTPETLTDERKEFDGM